MNELSKRDYQRAIGEFQALSTFHKGKDGKSKLIYENACKAIQILKVEMKEKYG